MNLIYDTAAALKKSPSVHLLIMILGRMANYINLGTNMADCFGFDMRGFQKSFESKNVKSTRSLLHYVHYIFRGVVESMKLAPMDYGRIHEL